MSQTIQAIAKPSNSILLPTTDKDYNFLSQLTQTGFLPNEDQWKAITDRSSRSLIHAGAGSGKTTTLVAKISYLIKQEKISPERILLLTFTNQASKDMIKRAKFLDQDAQKIKSGTFHSVFGSYLMSELGINDLYSNRLLKDTDRKFLIRSAMRQANINPKEINPEEVESFITLCKNSCIEPDEAIFDLDERLGHVYSGYEEMKGDVKFDFDDFVIKFSEIAGDVGRLFDAILVDEFQDVSKAQMVCLSAMLNEKNRFIAVGDPDQAIYSWRGSKPEYITGFDHLFPDSSIIKMGTNYRSHAEIVQCGRNIVSKNEDRMDIDLYGIRLSDHHPKLLFPTDERVEADNICDIISFAHNDIGQHNMAVLFRDSYYAEAIISELMHRKIEFKLDSDAFLIYDKPIVKAVMAMLEVRQSPNDLQLIGKFSYLAYLKKEQIPTLADIAEAQGITALEALPLAEYQYGNKNARNLLRAITHARKKPSQFIEDLISWYMEEYLYNQGLSGRMHIEELEYFRDAIFPFDNVRDINEHADSLREEIQKSKERAEMNADVLSLSTIHRSKGLEWDVVFVLGVFDGIMPHRKSEEFSLEEERRLAYVSVTRAKEYLYVSSPVVSAGKKTMSRFVSEMEWVKPYRGQ